MSSIQWPILIACIALCEIVGVSSGLVSGTGNSAWYQSLEKPWFTPPSWVFGPVWTLLYALMGWSVYLVYTSNHPLRTVALVLFASQLALNFAWTPLFFGAHLLGVALIEIVVLWVTVLATIVVFWRINPLAAYLLIPYLCWLCLAGALNGALWHLNK